MGIDQVEIFSIGWKALVGLRVGGVDLDTLATIRVMRERFRGGRL